MSEYQCSPLWKENIDGFYEPLEIIDVKGLSNLLTNRLEIWRKKFESTYNEINPIESGFTNDIELEAFEKEGVELWEELRRELSNYHIVFFSVKHNKLYEVLSDYKFC